MCTITFKVISCGVDSVPCVVHVPDVIDLGQKINNYILTYLLTYLPYAVRVPDVTVLLYHGLGDVSARCDCIISNMSTRCDCTLVPCREGYESTRCDSTLVPCGEGNEYQM